MDINQLRFTPQPPAPGGLSINTPSLGAATAVSFSLMRQPDGNSLLKIAVPQLPIVPGAGAAPAFSNLPSADQLAMIRPMFAGAKMSVVLEPAGALVRTSSPHSDGHRVTLLDVN